MTRQLLLGILLTGAALAPTSAVVGQEITAVPVYSGAKLAAGKECCTFWTKDPLARVVAFYDDKLGVKGRDLDEMAKAYPIWQQQAQSYKQQLPGMRMVTYLYRPDNATGRHLSLMLNPRDNAVYFDIPARFLVEGAPAALAEFISQTYHLQPVGDFSDSGAGAADVNPDESMEISFDDINDDVVTRVIKIAQALAAPKRPAASTPRAGAPTMSVEQRAQACFPKFRQLPIARELDGTGYEQKFCSAPVGATRKFAAEKQYEAIPIATGGLSRLTYVQLLDALVSYENARKKNGNKPTYVDFLTRNEVDAIERHWTELKPLLPKSVEPLYASTGVGNRLPPPKGGQYLITETMTPKLLELFRMHAQIEADEENARARYQAKLEAKVNLHADIGAGRVDALKELKRHHPIIDVPEGFTYDPGCSRALNMAGALFVSNEDIDADIKALGTKKNADVSDLAVLGKLWKSPAYLRAIAFYEKTPGWKRLKEAVASMFPVTNFEGTRSDTAEVTIYGLNQLSGLGDCKAKAGPVVMWSLSQNIRREDFENDFGLNAALALQWLDRDQFEIIRQRVYQAAQDHHHPESLQPPTGDDGGEYAARKKNAVWYARHAKEVDPLIWKE